MKTTPIEGSPCDKKKSIYQNITRFESLFPPQSKKKGLKYCNSIITGLNYKYI